MSVIRPERVTSGCYPVWFRADLPCEEAAAYWRGPHGQIASKNPAIDEYLQHHFALGDHGLWPALPTMGVSIPPDWRMDGVTEVRIKSIWAALWGRLYHMKANWLDEENVFDRVLAKNSLPKGSLWWHGPYQPATGFHMAVFIRARSGMRRHLHTFIEKLLAPALLDAGITGLRAHLFARGTRFTWWTPSVCHDEPANRRYDAMLLINAESREEILCILNSSTLTVTCEAQVRHCVAIHAYAIEHTYPLVLAGIAQTAGSKKS